jgi:hypothetical protein
MTAKEKARELVNKCNSLQASFYKDQDPSYGYAKQCALIAVDEMYDVASENNNVNQLNFLVDVKQEIINL